MNSFRRWIHDGQALSELPAMSWGLDRIPELRDTHINSVLGYTGGKKMTQPPEAGVCKPSGWEDQLTKVEDEARAGVDEPWQPGVIPDF